MTRSWPTGQAFQLTLDLRRRFNETEQFENIAVRSQTGLGGGITRIKDIGCFELGAQTYSQFLSMDGRLPESRSFSFLTPMRCRWARL
jgi:Cation/multidrug efflux pump